MSSVAFRGLSRRPVSIIAAATGVLLASLTAPGVQAQSPAAAAEPVEIGAHYSISFNGFNIGNVRFDQRLSGKSYTASSDVEISALLGAFHWKGVTRSAGIFDASGPKPSGYNFEYSGSARSGAVRMGFRNGAVNQLSSVPAEAVPADWIELTPAHLKNVVDPLTALVAATRPGPSGPCGRKFAMFDGKQRFDVGLIQRRKDVVGTAQNGDPIEGVVCRVKYTPIGGYRATADTEAMAKSTEIEVTFRPLPRTGLWLPARVSLPTIAGSVTLDATRIEISAQGSAQIALID